MVGTIRRVTSITIVMLVFLCVNVSAQESISVLLMPIEDRSIDTNEQAPRFERIVNEFLRAELERTNVKVSQDDQPDLFRIGGYFLFQADNWYVLTLNASRDQEVVSSYIIEGPFDVTLYNQVVRAIDTIISNIMSIINDERTIEVFRGLPTFRFTSLLDGVEVFLINNQDELSLGVVENGALEIYQWPQQVGAQIIIEKRKEGYYSERQTVTIDEPDDPVILTPIRKINNFGITLHSTIGQLAGVGLGFRYYIVPDTFFVGVENYFYFQPIPTEQRQTPQSINDGVSIFHNDTEIMLGVVLLPPTSIVRFGLGAGIGMIWSIVDTNATDDTVGITYLDFYINVLDVWGEVKVIDWLSIFVRGEFKWVFSPLSVNPPASDALSPNATPQPLLGTGRINNGLGDLLSVDLLSLAAITLGVEFKL